MKVGNFFAFALIGAACLSASCGGSTNGSTLLQQNDQPQLKDAAPAPDGVEPELWHSLLAELDRSIAFAPKLEPARVTNLELEWLPDGQVQARWEYNNPGDYDLNGVVNVSDLVPVGKHFGATAAQESWPAARVADGDGNGVVGISDITPIGAGFGNIVDAYYVLAGEEVPPDLTYSPGGENGEVVATVALAAAVAPPDGGLPVFTVQFPRHPLYSYYWVAPVDEDITFSGYDDIGIGGERHSIGTDIRGDWYMQYRDGGHSNRSALPGPKTNYVNWQLNIPGAGLGQPVYNADGMLFIGAEDGLYAINPDGTQAWIYPTDGAVAGSAAVGPNGAVYFGCDDGWLRAVSPQGDLLWSIEGGGPISTGVAVADDGTVYTASGASELLAVSPAGELAWRYASPGKIIDTPSIGQDGTVYAATESSQIIAINRDGEDRWESTYINSTGSYSDSAQWSPVLAVYPTYADPIEDINDYDLGEVALLARSCTSYGGRLRMFPVVDDYYAVWEMTTAWWDYSLAPETPLPPTVREDYSLLIPTRESALTAYDLETNQLWNFEYPTHNDCDYPVSLSADGNIYLSVYSRYDKWKVASLFALDSGGEVLWQLEFETESLSQPVIAPDYTVYVLSSEGTLYAIGGGAYNSAPQLPAGLTVNEASFSQINLSWNSSAGAGGYEVFRDTQDIPIAQLKGFVLKFIDEGLEPGAVHTYWIRAVNYYGASGFSEPATASTSINRPQDFSASDGLYGDRVVLTWSKSQNATGYLISRDTKFSNIVPFVSVGDVAEWHDTGVTDWDEHTYYIRATNNIVTSYLASDTGGLLHGMGDT